MPTLSPAVSAHLAFIGAKGGAKTSPAKKLAAAKNLILARAKLAKKHKLLK